MPGKHAFIAALFVLGLTACASAFVSLPPGFTRFDAATGLTAPTTLAFAADGRLFVAQQNGVVRVYINGVQQAQPFIDLSAEVGSGGYRGMLGLALDPDFINNHRVYMSFTVDPVFGLPDESDEVPTFNRVVRYTGTAASNGNIADAATRTILIGQSITQGIPACWAHTIDALRFGRDGMLLVSCGDGGHYEFADAGGNDAACFQPPYFAGDQNIGAFRAQYHLGSMNGKILRIDPNTGLGLPSNPFWDGDGSHAQSRIWLRGFRNPFRFAVQPGPPANSPGTLFIGDVGWNDWEEINVAAAGGLNFGWPCREGPNATPTYPGIAPTGFACGTLGNFTSPLVYWNHNVPDFSLPPGYVGANSIGGVFGTGTAYPLAYRGALFFADFQYGWIQVLRVDGNNALSNFFEFGDNVGTPVDMAMHPITGELHYVSIFDNKVYRIAYSGPGVGDVSPAGGDGHVNVADLLAVITSWGPCFGGPQICPADIDGSGTVNVADLLAVITNWG